MKEKVLSIVMVFLLVIIGIISFFISQSNFVSAAGITIYVDDDNTGFEDGSLSNPFNTISEGITAATNGDIVFVFNGTYNENLVIDKTINLTGEEKETTIIDGGGSGDVVYLTMDWINITGFTITNGGSQGFDAGIEIESNYHTISNNNILNNHDGIYMYSSHRNIISSNYIIDNTYGIFIHLSTNNIIINNNASYNEYNGIALMLSNQNNITNNEVHNNERGIDVRESHKSNIINNSASKNNIGIYLGSSNWVRIYKNQANLNSDQGFYLSNLYETNITNNIASSNYDDGIYLYNSNSNNISDNDASNNLFGISIYSSSGGNITGNLVLSNTANGIRLHSSNSNNITDNNVSENGDGIALDNSDDNIMTGNSILKNVLGVKLLSSLNNMIYHNFIINNTGQAHDDTNNGNQWDNSYPSGGNYWRDYTGVDLKKGNNQDQPGGDGIGDNPYIIDSDSQDKYPLIELVLDSLPPRIQLISPLNNSVIKPSVTLDFDVYDRNIYFVNYSVNGELEKTFSSPFNISTAGLDKGEHIVFIRAMDIYNNLASHSFYFTIDFTSPTIWFDPNINHSIILVGRTIQIDVSDPNIDSVIYSLDGSEYLTLASPYVINTSRWDDGTFIIDIKANDTAGNENGRWFEITIDAVFPYIISSIPDNNSKNVEVNATIIVNFNESMNQTATTNHVSISRSADFELYWDATGTKLSISFETNNLAEGTIYNLTIDSQLTDINGNPMGFDFILVFSTKLTPLDTDGDLIPDVEDDDDDNDGYLDGNDAFPLNATEWLDTDSDGIGNNADTDDDNDGIQDDEDYYPLDPSKWQEPVNWMGIIIIILVLLIASIVMAILLIKRKKGLKTKEKAIKKDSIGVKSENILDISGIKSKEEHVSKEGKQLPPPPPPR